MLAVLLATVAAAGEHVEHGELRELQTAARSMVGATQGIYIEAADGSILLAQAADQPVHPASVSKVPTTLALLRKFGPDYRFVTTFAASGAVHDGTLEGDLLVESGGDPYFVDENALLVVERLHESGVRRVAGGLRLRGALTFDWQSDADGTRLRQAMSGLVPPAAWAVVRGISLDNAAVAAADAASPPPMIQFAGAAAADGSSAAGGAAASERPLVVHRSQPLLSLAKSPE
jgi:D-alanyl-D-alanine carboxypeptidase/D-alanyl-D-alanine-endopeptidase (penicillin-binding protein 4)